MRQKIQFTIPALINQEEPKRDSSPDETIIEIERTVFSKNRFID